MNIYLKFWIFQLLHLSLEKKRIKPLRKKPKQNKPIKVQGVLTVGLPESPPGETPSNPYSNENSAYEMTSMDYVPSYQGETIPHSTSSKKSKRSAKKKKTHRKPDSDHTDGDDEISDDSRNSESRPAETVVDLNASTEETPDRDMLGDEEPSPGKTNHIHSGHNNGKTARDKRFRLQRDKSTESNSKNGTAWGSRFWRSSSADEGEYSSNASIDLTPAELLKIRRSAARAKDVPPIFASQPKTAHQPESLPEKSDHQNETDSSQGDSYVPTTKFLIPKYPIEELIPFLTLLAKTFHSYGAPVNRTEWNMAEVSEALGIEASYSVMPTNITITFGLPEGMDAVARTIRCDQNLTECGRLYLVEKLTQKIRSGEVDLYEARKQLGAIIQKGPSYHRVFRLLSFASSAGSAAILFFDGGWYDVLVATLLGFVVGLFEWATDYSVAWSRVFDIMSGLIAAAVCLPVAAYVPESCFSGSVLSSVVWLLPGLSLTVGVRELATRNLVAGTVRLFGAFMTALKIGLGIAFGSQLPFWIPANAIGQACTNSVNPYWRFLFFFTTVIPFNILLDTDLWQWPGQIFTSAAAYLIFWSCSSLAGLQSELVSVIAAFGVGILGNLYSLYTHNPGVVFIFSGIALVCQFS